jgi:hypothetical protein
MTFLAEVEDASGATVHLRYPIDPAIQVVILREWWEQLGSPEAVEVTIEPDR